MTTHNLNKIVGGALLVCGLALSGLLMASATAATHMAGSGGGAGKVAVGVHEQLITEFAHGSGGGAGKVTAMDQFRRFVDRFAPPPPP
jgi:hypothetical protein